MNTASVSTCMTYLARLARTGTGDLAAAADRAGAIAVGAVSRRGASAGTAAVGPGIGAGTRPRGHRAGSAARQKLARDAALVRTRIRLVVPPPVDPAGTGPLDAAADRSHGRTLSGGN